MNLYTQEQVKDLNYWKNNAEEDYLTTPISVLKYISELEKVTPIELPSDEEILNNACTNPIADDFMNDRQIGFVKGCKWMKEQILNQNK